MYYDSINKEPHSPKCEKCKRYTPYFILIPTFGLIIFLSILTFRIMFTLTHIDDTFKNYNDVAPLVKANLQLSLNILENTDKVLPTLLLQLKKIVQWVCQQNPEIGCD